MSGSSYVYIRNMTVTDIIITANGVSITLPAANIEELNSVFATALSNGIFVLNNYTPPPSAILNVVTTPTALPSPVPLTNLDFSYGDNLFYYLLAA